MNTYEIIKPHPDISVKLFDRYVDWIFTALDIDGVHIVLRFDTNKPCDQGHLYVNADEEDGDDDTGEDCVYYITLGTQPINAGFWQKLINKFYLTNECMIYIVLTLIHEMIHVSQFHRGDMTRSEVTSDILWKGIPRDEYKEDYRNLPWEKEAFEREKELIVRISDEQRLWKNRT